MSSLNVFMRPVVAFAIGTGIIYAAIKIGSGDVAAHITDITHTITDFTHSTLEPGTFGTALLIAHFTGVLTGLVGCCVFLMHALLPSGRPVAQATH